MRHPTLLRFVVVTAALLCAAAAYGDFTAFNDCVYDASHSYIGANVTTFNISTDSPGPSSGLLLDQATGNSTGVTATLTQSGGVMYQIDPITGGCDSAVGTDAFNTFGNIAGMQGTIFYGSDPSYVDLTFTGLDPSRLYTFATTANRGADVEGKTGYLDRVTKYTVSGADSYTNASTAGTTITDSGASTAFCTACNSTNGYVARWTDIAPGSDGTIAIRAGADDYYKFYAFDVFQLATQPVPEPSTLVLLAIGSLAALGFVLRRRK